MPQQNHASSSPAVVQLESLQALQQLELLAVQHPARRRPTMLGALVLQLCTEGIDAGLGCINCKAARLGCLPLRLQRRLPLLQRLQGSAA